MMKVRREPVSVSTPDLTQPSETVQDAATQCRQGGGFHPLLKIQIAPRLALGFLIPLLMAVIAIGNVGWQSQQLQARETVFYRSLVQGDSSLHSIVNEFDQLHGAMLGMLSDASKPGTSPETLTEDNGSINLYAGQIQADLDKFVRRSLFDRDADLVALFEQTNHRS